MRIIEKRVGDDEWEPIRMVSLKKGDVFRFSDETVRNDSNAPAGEHTCDSDGFINEEGIPQVSIVSFETTP